MGPFLVVLITITAMSVVAALLLGVAMMMRGGELNQKYGNKLMMARVGLQGLSLILLALLWAVSQ